MKKSIIMMASVLLFMVLISSVSSVVHAQEEVLSLKYVIFAMEDGTSVRTSMGDYGRAFSSNASGRPSLLWKHLKGDSIRPKLMAVGSENKYATIGAYGRSYSGMISKNINENLGYNASKIISESIKSTTAISEDIVSKYQEVVYIKDDKGNITGIESKPIDPIDPEVFKVIDIY